MQRRVRPDQKIIKIDHGNFLTCSKQLWLIAKVHDRLNELLTPQIMKAMKLTFIFLTAVFLHVSGKGIAQNVTLSVKDAPLEKVFREIEKQTGVGFLYTKKMLRDAPKVTISVKDAPVTTVLQECFKGQPLDYSIQNNTIVIIEKPVTGSVVGPESLPPPIDIKGRVVNEKGEPVAGITVAVKGTKNATATNNNGEFSLTGIDINATLVFTGVNVETYELKVGGKTDLGSVGLKTRTTTGETVSVVASTGYQTISRERATGSYDVVGPDVLSKRPVSNLSTALQGVVAGMQAKENADGSVSFLIRGTSSLYGETRPLVVVDGFPVADIDFSTINPNDVLSVTVLKDAAAASIWGARAANGVIVITTKKPKLGKLSIDVNAFTRISSYTDLDQVLTQANSVDHVNYEKLGWDRNLGIFYNGSFGHIGASLTLAQEYMQKRKVGAITDAQLTAGLDSLKNISNKGQLKDHLLQRAILSQFNVTLSGSTDRTKTYASLMFEKNKGGFVKNGYERFMFNFNNQYQAAKFLTFTIGTVLQYRKQETSGATIDEIQGLSPYETLLNPDGKYSVNLRSYNRQQLALLPLNKFPYSDWTYNLLREVRGRKFSNEDLNARVQAGINIKIVKGLEFDSKFQYERRKIEYESYSSEETFAARDLVNTWIDYDNITQMVGTQYLPRGGVLKTNNINMESYVLRNQLNYAGSFAKEVTVNAIVGTEVSSYETKTKENPWAYGYDPEKNQSSVPPYGYGSAASPIGMFRGFTDDLASWYGNNAAGGNTVFGWSKDKYVSFYGNSAFAYKGKYVLSASVRSDASNYITKDAKLRWSPLWSVGAMWNLKRENFIQPVKFIDDLRLRLTYGKNGNAEKSTSTEALVNMSTSISTVTGTITATSTPGNPFLRWEKTATTNLGIDFVLFKNKLVGKIDLYNKLGTDITGIVALPAATGVTSQKFNSAKIINKGIELELGTTINVTKAVSYNTALTYAYNYNRVKDLYFPNLFAFQFFEPFVFVEGRPTGAVYSFTYRGMINGTPNVEGPNKTLVSMNDLAVYNGGLGLTFLNYEGTGTAPHTLGWLSNINVHDFYFSALFIGKFGAVYRNLPFNYQTSVGFSKTFVNRFVADVFVGDTTVPGFPLPNNTRNFRWDRYAPTLNTLIESASFIECKEISLGYNLPEKLISKAGMSNMKVYVQARNLGLVWKENDKGYHPEWLPGTNRPVSTFILGANIQF